MYNKNEELYHYGVKNMKWGVIRSQKQLGNNTLSNKREVTKADIKKVKQHRNKGNVVTDRPIKIPNKYNGVKGMKWGVQKDRKRHAVNNVLKVPVARLKNEDNKIRKGQQFINNSHIMNLSIQQANQLLMEQATRASINAGLQTASLGMSGGTNPFMFGMM